MHAERRGPLSLSSLRKLPVQALKIDRCFVAALTRDEDAATIVRSAISLGKGSRTSAPWMSCVRWNAITQGYFIATPLSATALAEWLRRHAGAPAPQEAEA
jgi:EAL domain-containing protein (putative c-di-GMP-specific phosphodiesterase class I)